MKRNCRIAVVLCSVFVFLSGCSSFSDKTGVVSVCFDGTSLCRSADSAGSSLTVKLINADSGTVIDTVTKTVTSSDTQAEINFTAEIGLSVYLKAELAQSGTVVASGDSETVTVKDNTEVPLIMEWENGTVTVPVTLRNSSVDCTLNLNVTPADSAPAAVSGSSGITLKAGYAYTILLDAEFSGTAADYTDSRLSLYSGATAEYTSDTGSFTIQAYVTGTYKLFMEVCIAGIWYTGYETVVIE
ncbi:MAG: hypothetical protein WCR31_05790 [Treponema sp.]